MSDLNYPVLECLVSRYGESEEPVTERELAAAFGASRAEIEASIDALRACDLLRRCEGGVRPTVTGEELVASSIEGEFIVVDRGRESTTK